MGNPHISSRMEVEPGWIDFNGHMNMAYYSMLFDRAADEFYRLIGFGPDYAATRGLTTYTAEIHIRYLNELKLGEEVVVHSWLIGHDTKRFHCWQEIVHPGGGLAATAETMGLHIDMSGPRVASMPEDIAARLGAFAEAHGYGGTPEHAGRVMAIPSRQAG